MKNKKNWALALILTAAAGFVAVQNNRAPAAIDATTPTAIEATAAGCAYVWAYHDAPEITQKIDDIARGLDPKASAHASLYGEDCVYADGHADFHAMETDFYVRLPMADLTNAKAMGDWAAQVMTLIVKIPRGELQGNYGFVEFWFEKNEQEHDILRIPIPRYINEAQGKSGEELYKMFGNPVK